MSISKRTTTKSNIRVANRNIVHMLKGIVDIEFIMAVFVFLGTISFTTVAIGREFFSIRESAISQNVKLNGIIISDVLMFDKGSPENWDTVPIAAINRLGLSTDNKFVLDNNKISRLNALCDQTNPDYTANYNKIKELFGLQDDIILSIKTLDGTTLLDCRPSVETLLRARVSSEGYAVINNNNKISKFTASIVVS